MWWIEAIGICATVFILISMCVDTNSWRGGVWLRIINIIGSVVFVVYGALLPAISTAVLNGLLVFVNSYHLIKLLKNKPKTNNTEEKQTEQNNAEINNENSTTK